MLNDFDLLSGALRVRADLLILAVASLAGCGLACRRERRGAMGSDLAWTHCRAVLGVTLLGGLLAEGITSLSGYPAPGAVTRLFLARAFLLVGTAAVAGVLLRHAVQFARLRAALRAHADMERQLQCAKRAADEANRAKTDFLAVMSHEIRTPLNAVMGFANLLGGTELDDAQRGYLATISSEGARLGSLINDVLDLTKIEEGRLLLERLPFAPAEIVHDVLRLLGARALEKKLELRFETQLAEPLLVAGDPLRFRQVLLNLVDNAVKFTPQGAVTVCLDWDPPAGASPHGRLSIRVRDTGIGIPEAKRKDIFQMFMQADTSTTRRYGGTGLGLAICQRLVTLMGGEIAVTSVRGAGSEFAFTLPLGAVPGPGATVLPEPAPVNEPTPPARVLIVDDMETNRFLLEVFLRRNGFIPEVAAGGEAAVRLAAANDYDAILMDLQMPEVDGYTATQRIRAAEPAGRRTLIIALTASVTRGTREKCLAAGMDEHLNKPLDLRRFKTLLSSLLAGGENPVAA